MMEHQQEELVLRPRKPLLSPTSTEETAHMADVKVCASQEPLSSSVYPGNILHLPQSFSSVIEPLLTRILP